MSDEPKRYYKFVGETGFNRLPRGVIDPQKYESLTPDLRHIVLHSGSWVPMTDAEIAKHEGQGQKSKAETPNANASEEVKN